MDILSHQIGPVTVIELEGPMNLNSMRWLQDSLEDRVASGELRLVFSLRDVTLISSSGLGALIQFSQDFKHRKGRLALAALHQTGKEVMAITKLDTLFAIYDTVDDAVASLRDPA
jgi:anti-sigma B factor antagonist